MDYLRLPGTELEVSRLILGCEPLGGTDWGDFRPQEVEQAVCRAWDLGINGFDVADVYGLGEAETRLARCLGSRRREAVIITKFGVGWQAGAGLARALTFRDASPAHLRAALEGSLRRLKLDCLPLYLVHWPDPRVPVEETLAALQDCQRQGKIRYFGVSNYSGAELRRAAAAGTLAAVQGSFSLLDRRAEAEALPACRQHGLAYLAYGPLAQGLLSGKYGPCAQFPVTDRRAGSPAFRAARDRAAPVLSRLQAVADQIGRTPAQVALRWVLDHPGVACAIAGARTPAQAESNAQATGWTLEADRWEWLGGPPAWSRP